MFPPSPCQSDCDSLADIEDLDAFLEAQGEISHFPTPPRRKDDVVVEEVEVDSEEEVGDLDSRHVAETIAQELCSDASPMESDILLIHRILLRAHLPVEILALAFNILSNLKNSGLLAQEDTRIPLNQRNIDLRFIPSLVLAAAYSMDHPPPLKWWSRHITDIRWTPSKLDQATMNTLAALDWRLHSLSTQEAIDKARAKLERPPIVDVLPKAADGANVYSLPDCAGNTLCIQSSIFVGTMSTYWSHGLVTPDEISPPVELLDPRGPFLRLL